MREAMAGGTPPDAPAVSALEPSTSAPPSSPRRCSSGSRTAPHRPALVVTRPGPAEGPRPAAPVAAGRRAGARARPRRDPARAAARSRAAGADRRRGAGGRVRVRVRRADQGAAAVGLRDDQRASVAAAALARRRAASSGRSWRATRRPASRSCALTAGLDSGPVCLQESEPIHADDDYGSLAARLRRVGGDLLVRALDERPPFVEQDETRVTYAHKIEAADRALDPDAHAGGARADGPRAAPAHRRPRRAAGRRLPRRDRRRAWPRAGQSPAASAPTVSASCSAPAAARSS